ncbi:MAG: VWA domain-containing protein [Vicinamibacterales bacterium]
MALLLTDVRALWLLAFVPVVWIALGYVRTNFNRRQQLLQAAIRSLLLVLLAVAASQPVLTTRSSGLSIVYLVDVSHSILSRSIAAAAARIDAIDADLRPAHSRILAFGGAAGLVADTASLRKLASPDSEGGLALQRESSDLERALDDARMALAPGRSPRVVLFSDGRETSGDVRDAALRLGMSSIPMFIEPMETRDLGDSWTDAVVLPSRVIAGALVPVNVSVSSQRAVTGTLELRESGRVLAAKPVTLEAGTTTIRMDVTFPNPGTRAIEAALQVADDPLRSNNVLARDVSVEPRARVLYVESQPASAKYLQRALADAGFDVDVRAARDLPRTLTELESSDVVVLSDLDRASIPDASMTALATWVEKEGGGLLVVGGPNVFGVGVKDRVAGYRHTELERLLPVTFERNDDPEVALVIVLDKSWSMAGQVIALCKAAAQAAIDVLGDEHMVGVITFNDGFGWDVPMRPVGPNRPSIKTAVANIEASGYTLIYPAVEQAYQALQSTKARAKHVVLLSDGKSSPADFEGLIKKMTAAKITVSTLAVGPGADAELLTDIAKWGNGRSYVVMDPRQVVEIFVTEAKGAATPSFEEGKPITPVVASPAFLRGLDLRQMPVLRGRTATILKEHALEVLSTDGKDPLLTFWPIGLGHAAVFASDLKDRWGAEWIRWRGYGPLVSAIVHALERSHVPALDVTPGVVRGGRRTLSIAVELRDPSGAYRNLMKPRLRVTTADGEAAETTVRQVSPGRYQTSIVADASQNLTLDLIEGPDIAASSSLVLPDPVAEYRFRPPDMPLLRAMAAATGGQVGTDTAAIVRAAGPAGVARRVLWPWLIGAAIAVWLMDVALRRIRLFEPAS